jgi:hypothetical protein
MHGTAGVKFYAPTGPVRKTPTDAWASAPGFPAIPAN